MSAERKRLTLALLVSLLLHTLVLSLTFGGEELGLPGFGFPWQERRVEAPELRVVLLPAQIAAAADAEAKADTSIKEPLQQASIEQPVAGGPVLTLSVSPAPSAGRTAEVIVPKTEPAAEAKPEPDIATVAAPAKAPLRTEGSGDAVPTPIPGPAVIAMERSDEAKWVVPAAPSAAAPVIAAAPGASNPETAMPGPRDAGDATQERTGGAGASR